MKATDKISCAANRQAVQDTLDIIGGKWKILILLTLTERPYRFKELAREINISPRMLSRELQDMEMNQLISRKVLDEKPIGVEYAITDYGRTFKKVIHAMRDWGMAHRNKIMKSKA